ncbi:hypothetical protein MCUN1_000259 [Malassezia cuniculi]|uniref:UDENN domain-containing protein n=1 Tax=Malassezia cuniculi TaxID=948313 RepID=A0AAF0ERX1_9BASI|nr:hypothetical protein MCUN1_000259 [Malassezia cuniculi]
MPTGASDGDASGDIGLVARRSIEDMRPDQNTAAVAPEARRALQHWVLATAVVNFDLDRGPDVEFLYPPLAISQAEKDNIAFSAFPDTSVFEQGTLVFSWRVREVPGTAEAEAEADAAAADAARASGAADAVAAAPRAPAAQSNSRSTSYIYGYSFFVQRADPSVRRSYTQKSLVILTHLPYVALFSKVVDKVGSLYFELGMPVLESFVQEVGRWPLPESGATIELPLFGARFSVALPHGQEAQRPWDGQETILASVPTASFHATLHAVVSSLWLLWEILILGEPLLVVAGDPRTASDAVWHLLDLIRPVPCAGDFRPYFHIHDYDYAALVSRNKPPAGTILGVTNPFFLQACSHWPHVLHLGWRVGATRRGGAQAARFGLETQRKRRVVKDKALLKAVSDLCSHGEHGKANVMLRRYFADLTERFLAPLNRYVASLVPDLSSADAQMRPFSVPDFIASLSVHSTPLPMRARPLPATTRNALYTDFLRSPNFSLWLQVRVAAVEEEQWQRRAAALTVPRDHLDNERLAGEIDVLEAQLARVQRSSSGLRWLSGVSPTYSLRRKRSALRAQLAALRKQGT